MYYYVKQTFLPLIFLSWLARLILNSVTDFIKYVVVNYRYVLSISYEPTHTYRKFLY